MNDLKRAAIILDLAKHIARKGSWSGETHMQKATYLLQSLAGEDLGYDFVMHIHGPFSYDLRDDLRAMSADGFISMILQGSYGPRLKATELADNLISRFPKTINNLRKSLEFVSDVVGIKDVKDLERSRLLYLSPSDIQNPPDNKDQQNCDA